VAATCLPAAAGVPQAGAARDDAPRPAESHRFRSKQMPLWLSLLAYNLANLWRLALPKRTESWSLTSLQQRLVKPGGRLVPPRGMRAIIGCCWPRGTCVGGCFEAC